MKTTETDEFDLRWEVRQRYRFIEFRLYWEGKMNLGDLQKSFRISKVQASKDLKNYQELAPGNTTYDANQKFYIPMPEFNPLFMTPDSSEYLMDLQSRPHRGMSSDFSKCDSLITPLKHVETQGLQRVLRAIRDRHALTIKYKSMKRTEPLVRDIIPHALVSDGIMGWDVRAYCPLNEEFRNFALKRILSVYGSQPFPINTAADIEWEQFITVEIGPHPDLNESERRTVELDYQMEKGKIVFDIRYVLLYYLLKRYGLDEGSMKVSPQEQQIVLLNIEEIQKIKTVIEIQKKKVKIMR